MGRSESDAVDKRVTDAERTSEPVSVSPPTEIVADRKLLGVRLERNEGEEVRKKVCDEERTREPVTVGPSPEEVSDGRELSVWLGGGKSDAVTGRVIEWEAVGDEGILTEAEATKEGEPEIL